MEKDQIKNSAKSNSFSFDNTEIAFTSKSDQELKNAYRLFRVINNNFLVKIGPAITKLAIKLKLPIRGLIRASIFKQFCGGETINESVEVAEELGKYHISSILDYSVEGEAVESEFDQTMDEIIKTIRKASGNIHIPFSVFKVSGLGRSTLLSKEEKFSAAEKAEFQRIGSRVNELCKASYNLDVPIMIDAEESWIQGQIDTYAIKMMEKYNKEKAIVFNTVQLYRHDRLAWLKDQFNTSVTSDYFLGVKLVRGAYMEKERQRAKSMNYISPIHNDKAATDHDFNKALEFCIQNADRISMVSGSHNEESCMILINLMKQNHFPINYPHIWFAQLLGMSDNLSFNLAAEGYNVAKYLPYGPVKSVMPYLFRRAEENTAISGQMSRELSLIVKEVNRRKQA